MTEEEMWRAASQSDAAFDGAFFYAVKSTGVFCRPSCPSRVPNRENVLFYKTAADAGGAGFRPCKRCRPDIPGYAPVRAIAEAARAALEAGQSPAVPGVSPRRLSAVFKQTYGATLSACAGERRLAAAKRLLAETDVPVLEVADAVGFRALSAFYLFFKRGTGQTPAAYRREHRKK